MNDAVGNQKSITEQWEKAKSFKESHTGTMLNLFTVSCLSQFRLKTFDRSTAETLKDIYDNAGVLIYSYSKGLSAIGELMTRENPDKEEGNDHLGWFINEIADAISQFRDIQETVEIYLEYNRKNSAVAYQKGGAQ